MPKKFHLTSGQVKILLDRLVHIYKFAFLTACVISGCYHVVCITQRPFV